MRRENPVLCTKSQIRPESKSTRRRFAAYGLDEDIELLEEVGPITLLQGRRAAGNDTSFAELCHQVAMCNRIPNALFREGLS